MKAKHMTILVRIRTTNDRNGHPRRAWVRLSSDGRPVEWIDEGYSGYEAIPQEYRGALLRGMLEVNVTPSEYKKTRQLVRLER